MSEPIRTIPNMPHDQDDTYLMKPGEVRDLLRISRTTLHEWREAGRLHAVRHHPKGIWYYPATQGVLADARAAVRAKR